MDASREEVHIYMYLLMRKYRAARKQKPHVMSNTAARFMSSQTNNGDARQQKAGRMRKYRAAQSQKKRKQSIIFTPEMTLHGSNHHLQLTGPIVGCLLKKKHKSILAILAENTFTSQTAAAASGCAFATSAAAKDDSDIHMNIEPDKKTISDDCRQLQLTAPFNSPI